MKDNKTVWSEQTKDMTLEELSGLQEKIEKMTPEELDEYRKSADADSMGFHGEECV